jgi:hypothetical protein
MAANVSEVSKETTSKLINSLTSTEGVEGVSGSSTDAEILGSIYKLMVRTEGLKKLRYDKEISKSESLERETQKKHEEIINALSVEKKIPKKKSEESKPVKIPKSKQTAEITKKGAEPTKTVTSPTPNPATLPQKQVSTPASLPQKQVAPPAALPQKQVATSTAKTATKVATPASTASKVIVGAAGVGLGAIAAISILGETGAKGKKATMAKSGQVVPNDPEPGAFSYGFFGMNSKAKTIHAFVGSHPEFGLTAKPGTDEFNKQWEALAQSRPEELYNAQLDWYDKNILQPLRKDLKSLQLDYANDDRILAYMADRRIQYGKTMETQALKYASAASTAPEFINRITDFDLDNIGTAFKTYLSNNKNNSIGLKNRIERRKMLAMQVTQDTGTTLDATSKNNTELWQARKDGDSAESTINKTNVSMNQQSGDVQNKKEDDRSAYERKKNSK